MPIEITKALMLTRPSEPQPMSPEAQEFLGTFASETFYYWASVFMLLIHAGFLAYEGGASRTKNHLFSCC
jgi:hypothetical protein